VFGFDTAVSAPKTQLSFTKAPALALNIPQIGRAENTVRSMVEFGSQYFFNHYGKFIEFCFCEWLE
jgi:hypothetical protein